MQNYTLYITKLGMANDKIILDILQDITKLIMAYDKIILGYKTKSEMAYYRCMP